MKVHFIAIGGSAMHNLAIALHLKGYEVSGSDDEIFDPSKGRLAKYGLLPDSIGWDPARISKDINSVILGMHARADNPELAKAQELGIPIFSYPEYLYEQTKNKKRVVIGGSHGKTSITSMILHVLQHNHVKHDYMVGAQLEGFECMVSLKEDSTIAILEGDEYLSSPIDRRPKFHLYQPNIALLSGIAWDHINVFPTFENYVEQFQIFVDKIEPNGDIIYYDGDENVKLVAQKSRADVSQIPYDTHPHRIEKGITYLLDEEREYPLHIFGEHNLQNVSGALNVCLRIGLSKGQFYAAIISFKGASKRLELVTQTSSSLMYKDFAHSPSKLKATTQALKDQFPDRKLIACMELHTFSSLNKDFLDEYDGAMKDADEAFVYFNPHTIAHKKLTPISKEDVKKAFNSENVRVYTSSEELTNLLKEKDWNDTNLLMMTSGTFDGVDFKKLGEELFT
ncbi:UDP-N-acetylmuramate--L-alanine ligase [Parvicella tangerina]|uniref:UDP-N-acetylmuramate--L-alanyl-gamma-D-glutamyl-meso-2,6-diaminoheptandioate ligase n=1 Tax=Parvicella tangerina TaxID=2829795 RepID=A0A916ND27_9FLAO|nr:Mur ligase family protein [Parvicella tangerina]CAG5086183.1 UDP-N-acetylmuramate--L-alanyl-gamma-D-glutamyl-meso-2,6-diaminoheptandioate ligase [Parvicella tangerina]